ncbi:MAG: chorismate synthase [Bacteroidetes bacterium GWA2_30_7]|nr:MAG: chorismate synthase [Bacteroidetes bacterium GWA2_30_7]
MSSNSIGKLFTLTTFGESHGYSIGGIIDGCPANIKIDFALIKKELKRRSPKSEFETKRNEIDDFEIVSGLYNGVTLGSPIAFIIKNTNKRSVDYDNLENIYRPSHSDFTYSKKYGIRDPRGGGRASARETTSWVFAGAVAKQILNAHNIEIAAFVSQIGDIKLEKNPPSPSPFFADSFITRCPDKETDLKIQKHLNFILEQKDSCGGIITCNIKNLPIGLGEPIFDKLPARLAHAMMTINAVKGFEIGEGFNSAILKGSEYNDEFIETKNQIRTKTNHAGGTLGGISNGEDLVFRVAFKPIASILQKQNTVDTDGKATEIEIKGRHDVCVVPRAIPIVEAMAALVLVDFLLIAKAYKL